MDLYRAASSGDLKRVQELLEQGADIVKVCGNWTPLIGASYFGLLEVVRYLLEQGANRDKADPDGWTPLHLAAGRGHLEIAKLLMVYGADLNAKTIVGQLPIDMARNEEIKQAIRDEPRRRLDEAPGKRATEQDRHPNSAVSAVAEPEEEEQSKKRPRLEEGKTDEVAEEDQDSDPSSDEDGN